MPLEEFGSTITAGERPQTHALDRAANRIGIYYYYYYYYYSENSPTRQDEI
jgi:hypothetical protein